MQGGDGRLLVEAAGLPAVVSAAALPQVDAEDFPRSAAVEQHRDLGGQRDGCLAHICLLYCVGSTRRGKTATKRWTYPNGKLLSQNIAAGAVRLRPASLRIFHDHSTGQACRHV